MLPRPPGPMSGRYLLSVSKQGHAGQLPDSESENPDAPSRQNLISSRAWRADVAPNGPRSFSDRENHPSRRSRSDYRELELNDR